MGRSRAQSLSFFFVCVCVPFACYYWLCLACAICLRCRAIRPKSERNEEASSEALTTHKKRTHARLSSRAHVRHRASQNSVMVLLRGRFRLTLPSAGKSHAQCCATPEDEHTRVSSVSAREKLRAARLAYFLAG